MLTARCNHPFMDHAICVQRLLKEAHEHDGKLIVAFDFDNTIFDFHNNGGNYSDVIALLRTCSEMNMVMILFTAQDDEKRLEWIVAYCHHFGIRVDFINRSPIMNTIKPYFNILLDDRAGLSSSYYQLVDVVNELQKTNDTESSQPEGE